MMVNTHAIPFQRAFISCVAFASIAQFASYLIVFVPVIVTAGVAPVVKYIPIECALAASVIVGRVIEYLYQLALAIA